MTNNDTLANRIIQRRAELNMNQEDLSKAAGIAPAQISRYEAGKNKPRPNIIAKLAKALEVHFAWLAYGDISDTYSIVDEKDKHEYMLHVPHELNQKIIKDAEESGMKPEDFIVKLLIESINNDKITKS